MKGILHFGVFCLILLAACSEDQTNADTLKEGDPLSTAYSGSGLFRLNEAEKPGSLFPPSITDVVSARIASQVYEGLFRLDPGNLEPIPCIAEKWNYDESTRELMVWLKKDVFFHDDPCFPKGTGRRLGADDVVTCFTRLASPSKRRTSISPLAGVLIGAEEYFESEKVGGNVVDFQGVKYQGENQVSFFFAEGSGDPFIFLSQTIAYIYPQEALDKYGYGLDKHMVGTGPFRVSSWEEGLLLLEKNPSYHLKNNTGLDLPLLDGLAISFIMDKKEELSKFRSGALDMIYSLPNEYVSEVLKDSYTKGGRGFSHYHLIRTPELSTEILGFNLQKTPFSNEDFRKAIAFSINKNSLVDGPLKGQAYSPGTAGFVPPGFSSYRYDSTRGYVGNQDSALIYLERSGVNIDELPVLDLCIASKGNNNVAVADEIRKQLKEALGLEIGIRILSFSDLVSGVSKGEIDFYRIGWAADFPSVTEFLDVFASNSVPLDENEISFPNVGRYRNKKFDNWLNKARNSFVDSIRMACFSEAEQILMRDCPIVVLWYDEGFQLLQPYVKNLKINPIQYRDFREVYFELPEGLAEY